MNSPVSTSANDRQVGGTHYASSYQHWDFAEDAELGGHEWQITRYISRHRKKNGLQDVMKAIHHTIKLLEIYRSGRRLPKHGVMAARCFERWVDANKPAFKDALIMAAMCTWEYEKDLEVVLDQLRRIEGEYLHPQPAVSFADAPEVKLTPEQVAAMDEMGDTTDPKPASSPEERQVAKQDPEVPLKDQDTKGW